MAFDADWLANIFLFTFLFGLVFAVASVFQGGVHIYTKAGSRFTSVARNFDGAPTAKGTEVVILGFERGLASVQAVDTLLRQKENDR